MEFWQKARSFAESAAKRSQELTVEAAKRSQEITIGSSKLSEIVSETAKRSKEFAAEASKRSQELTIGSSKISDIVSETAKRSKELAAEASKRADQIKVEAIKRADQIKSSLSEGASSPRTVQEQKDLEKFGVTDDLREFVKGITINTFQDFPLEDDSELSSVPTVSNVRQDLTEWQVKHAQLVLQTVKEVSKLRYELCPRSMKERKFWRIYFLLVNSHVAPYEKQYMEEKLKSSEQDKNDNGKEPSKDGIDAKPDTKSSNHQSKTSTSSSTEQDLDAFLLGDLGDSDEGPDDGDGNFDDDFDKMSDGLDDEKSKV